MRSRRSKRRGMQKGAKAIGAIKIGEPLTMKSSMEQMKPKRVGSSVIGDNKVLSLPREATMRQHGSNQLPLWD